MSRGPESERDFLIRDHRIAVNPSNLTTAPSDFGYICHFRSFSHCSMGRRFPVRLPSVVSKPLPESSLNSSVFLSYRVLERNMEQEEIS